MKTKFLISLISVFAALQVASADVRVTTFDSKVVSVPPVDRTAQTYTYKVYGPGQVEYIVEGPTEEVTRLAQTVRSNPDATIRFEGEVIEGPKKTFRLKSWRNSTTTETDAFGNKQSVTTTETTTER